MSNIVVKQINGGPTGVINAIINGNFDINQRAVSGTVTLASGVYGHDRWKAGASGCTYTFATVANVITLTITAGSLIQVIEGLNLGSGTYTLSFAGTAQGKIGAGSFSGSGVTGAAVGGTNLNIEFNTGTLSLVQFEQGAVATPFERRPFGAELALCQRYYEKSYDADVAVGGSSGGAILAVCCGNTNRAFGHTQFKVSKRASPTVTYYSTAGASGNFRNASQGTNVAVAPAAGAGMNSASYVISSGIVSVTDQLQGHYTSESEL